MGHLQENKDNLHSNNSYICKKAVCLHLDNWKRYISHMKLLELDYEMKKSLVAAGTIQHSNCVMAGGAFFAASLKT